MHNLSYTATAHQYKRRPETGRIPLHTTMAVSLAEQPSLPSKPVKMLQRLAFSFFQDVKNGVTVIILIGYYEAGVKVEHHFPEGLSIDSGNRLLPLQIREPLKLQSQTATA